MVKLCRGKIVYITSCINEKIIKKAKIHQGINFSEQIGTLLYECEKFGINHDIKYNAKKYLVYRFMCRFHISSKVRNKDTELNWIATKQLISN